MYTMIDRWLRVNKENEVRRIFVVGVADIAILAQFVLDIFKWLTLYSSIGVVEPIYVDECEFNFARLLWLLFGVCGRNYSDEQEERENRSHIVPRFATHYHASDLRGQFRLGNVAIGLQQLELWRCRIHLPVVSLEVTEIPRQNGSQRAMFVISFRAVPLGA